MTVCCVHTAVQYPPFNHNIYAALRVEWLKARARRDRWKEEVDLLVTEISRAALFFNNRAEWWNSLVGRRSQLPPDLLDGLRAYAAHQADIQHRHACHVRSLHDTSMHTPTSSPPPLPSEQLPVCCLLSLLNFGVLDLLSY